MTSTPAADAPARISDHAIHQARRPAAGKLGCGDAVA
jgi:hypothetical protein